ncbi:MAG TPA: biotin/lipoyl-containing protein, partial [Acidimicrobiales bacterium]|nr:biotin/lipoyl-containing protein [Acidimicrobiales bacterium]
MGDFTMPSLGADMEAGTITQWLVKPGDEVHRGDIVAVVETEKSTIEVEIFENGVIDELVVPEGERVPVGTVLARLSATRPAPRVPRAARPARRPPAEAAPAEVPAPKAPPAEAPPAAAPPGPSTPSIRPAPPSTVRSPIVRHLAEQLHVDTAAVPGRGPG